LGVRVPALLISPYATKSVYSETLDHTSIGAYLVERFGIEPLGARMANAHSFSDVLTNDPDNMGPENIPSGLQRVACGIEPLAIREGLTASIPNENQLALDVLSRALVDSVPIQHTYGRATSTAQSLPIVDDNPRTRALRFLRSTEN
jgi:hypothetical protein